MWSRFVHIVDIPAHLASIWMLGGLFDNKALLVMSLGCAFIIVHGQLLVQRSLCLGLSSFSL